MRVGGAWVGLGIGDASEEVRRIKRFMRQKFSYAKHLNDSPIFDEATAAAVADMQGRYRAAGKLPNYMPGVVNVATKVAMGFVPPPPPKDTRPVLFTVCGTGVPWWIGPDADTARAVERKWLWQPTGYPARNIPMGPSISAGRDELFVLFNRHRARIEQHGCALAAYSQGAIVASEFWLFDIPTRVKWAQACVKKAVMWGNPMREQGVVFPDRGGAPAGPTTHGVTETLMSNTPPWWREYAHRGDLYTDVPADESGENRRAIWKVIRDGDMLSGTDSLLSQLVELTGATDNHQAIEVTGMFKAMLDALVFFGRGTTPHTNYSVAEAIEYLGE